MDYQLLGFIIGLPTLIIAAIGVVMKISKAMRDGDSEVHKRIDTMQNKLTDMQNKFVCRDELNSALSRMENNFDRLGEEVRGMGRSITERIDQLMTKNPK